MKLTGESRSRGSAFSALLSQIETSSSGAWKGSGRSSTVSTMLKIAVAAPAPRPSVRMAMAANEGARRHWRHAQRTSPARPVSPLAVDCSLIGRDSGVRVFDMVEAYLKDS